MTRKWFLTRYSMEAIHQKVVNSKTGSAAAKDLKIGKLNRLNNYLSNYMIDGSRLDYESLKRLPNDAIKRIRLAAKKTSVDTSIASASTSWYSSSMIDDLIKPFRDSQHNRANINVADNIPIESLNVWHNFIKSNYARYDHLLLPLNINNNHWVLVYINRLNHFLGYIDPLGAPPPQDFYHGFNALNKQDQIKFNELFIFQTVLQKDDYQCGPWLVLIIQTLLAGSMNYDSETLLSLLSSLKNSDIAQNRLDQQQRLLSDMDIGLSDKKRLRPESYSRATDGEQKAKKHCSKSLLQPARMSSQHDRKKIFLEDNAEEVDLNSTSSAIGNRRYHAAKLTGYQAALSGSSECLNYANQPDYLVPYYEGYFNALVKIGIVPDNEVQRLMWLLRELAHESQHKKDDLSVYYQALDYVATPEVQTWLMLAKNILQQSHFPFIYHKVPVIATEISGKRYLSEALIIDFNDYSAENFTESSKKITLSLKAKQQLARLFTMKYQQILASEELLEGRRDALQASFHEGYLFVGHYSCLSDLISNRAKHVQEGVSSISFEEVINDDIEINSDDKMQEAQDIFIAANKTFEPAESHCSSSPWTSNRFFATPNSPFKSDTECVDDELSITKICEDNNDDYELYSWY